MTRESVIEIIQQIVAGIKVAPVSTIDINKSLIDYGFDSMDIGELVIDLQNEFQLDISAEDFWEGDSIKSMADTIVKKH